MNITTRAFALCIIGILFSSHAVAWFDAWPEVEVPTAIQSQWIAKDMQHNGVDMRIIQLHGAISAQKTLHFYQDRWGNSPAKYNLIGTDTQILLSTVVEHRFTQFLVTLELKADQTHTNGVLSILRFGSPKPHPAANLDPNLPRNATIQSDTLSKDLGSLNRTLVATTQDSTMQTIFHFEEILTHQDWTQAAQKVGVNSTLLRFTKPDRELTIHLSETNTTHISVIYTQRI